MSSILKSTVRSRTPSCCLYEIKQKITIFSSHKCPGYEYAEFSPCVCCLERNRKIQSDSYVLICLISLPTVCKQSKFPNISDCEHQAAAISAWL